MLYQLPSTDPLGTDLHLDPNGDLVTTISGSLDLVTLQDNVSQAVRTNLTTLPYSYLWGNGVGTYLAQYIDAPITSTLTEEVKSSIINQVNQDPRILEILGVDLDQDYKDTLVVTVNAVVQAVGVVQIPINVGR